MATKRSAPSRRITLAILTAFACVSGAWEARGQDDRDYMRVIGRPEMLVYAADVATALSRTAHRKFPQIEQSSAEGSRRTFCTTLRDSPDLMIAPFAADLPVEKLCANDEPLLGLPFGRQAFIVYTAPGGPHLALTREQLYRAIARELPRGTGNGGVENGFEPNPNKRWQDISPDLPDIPIRVLGPPRRALQWLTLEDLLMRPACMRLPAVAALARLDERAAEQHCLARRTDAAVVYTDGEAYNASPAIVPKGTELAINERRAMQLMPDAVPQPIDGVMPDDDALNANRYTLARPMIALVKVNRLDTIPNLRNFIIELLSPAASGPKGYLVRNGMDPLPPAALSRAALSAQFARPGIGEVPDEAPEGKTEISPQGH
jgi:phosphate transport system substrate-binding protein